MRIGAVVGGIAVVGVAVLVGLALTDDASPETNNTETSLFVFGPDSTGTVTTVPPEPSSTAPPSTAGTSEPATTALIPPEQRSTITVRVVNGGAPVGAATSMSEMLRSNDFSAGDPDDARQNVAATEVLYAPGRSIDAATVNEVVKASPQNVVAARADDPNWAAFGSGLAVLVVLGPAGG